MTRLWDLQFGAKRSCSRSEISEHPPNIQSLISVLPIRVAVSLFKKEKCLIKNWKKNADTPLPRTNQKHEHIFLTNGAENPPGPLCGAVGCAPLSLRGCPGTGYIPEAPGGTIPGVFENVPGPGGPPKYAPGTAIPPGHVPCAAGYAPGAPGNAPGALGNAPGAPEYAPGAPGNAPGAPGYAPGAPG